MVICYGSRGKLIRTWSEKLITLTNVELTKSLREFPLDWDKW